MRVLRSPAFWVILAFGCTALFSNLGVDSPMSSNAIMASERPSLSTMAKEVSVMREGTIVTDVKVRFRKQGERYQFIEDGGNKTYKCLENLSLQRIDASQQDDDRKVAWVISAKVTEFKGENFLMVEKTIRSR